MLIEVKNIIKDYNVGLFGKGTFRAVDNVSFSIKEGETLGLVGESGCGKSTLARLILMLIKPTSGNILYNGKDLTKMSFLQLQNLRKEMQIVFQHPQQSLNPRMKIYDSIAEPLRLHKLVTNKYEEKELVFRLIESVGISTELLQRYPHELSGGQCQRVAIARVLALKPKFIVADEPTSMLDVSVQAQILHLIKELQKEYNIGMLFISHDLEVVQAVSDNIAVMHWGKIVEIGSQKQIFMNPNHSYTKHLISTILDVPERDGSYAI